MNRGTDLLLLMPGLILPYGGAAVPAGSGWLACDGAAVSRTTYAALFAAVGTTHVAGDGSTTFNLPDRRGRALIGAGQGAGLTSRVVGAKGGEESHLLTEAEIPGHVHPAATGAFMVTGFSGGSQALPAGNGSGSTGATGSAGGGTAHNNMPPFAVVHYAIKT